MTSCICVWGHVHLTTLIRNLLWSIKSYQQQILFSIRVTCSPELKTICWDFWKSEYEISISRICIIPRNISFPEPLAPLLCWRQLKNQYKEMMHFGAFTLISLFRIKYEPQVSSIHVLNEMRRERRAGEREKSRTLYYLLQYNPHILLENSTIHLCEHKSENYFLILLWKYFLLCELWKNHTLSTTCPW